MSLAKPSWPTWQPSHPLGGGLRAFFAANEPAGTASSRDTVGGLTLNATGGATIGQGGIVCDATGKGFESTLPASLKLPLPITIACQLRFMGAPGANAGIFGLLENNTNADPFVSGAIQNSSGGFFAMTTNNGGTFDAIESTTDTASRVGFHDILVGVLTAKTRTLYLNGTSIAFASGAFPDPNYGVTALIAAGNYTGVSRNSNCVIEGGAVWSRALSQAEVNLLGLDFFAPIRFRSTLALFAATAPAASTGNLLFGSFSGGLLSLSGGLR